MTVFAVVEKKKKTPLLTYVICSNEFDCEGKTTSDLSPSYHKHSSAN